MTVDGWTRRSLGDLTENFDAQRIPVKERDRRPGPYPYYGASGVVDHVDGYIFDGEYLLIAEDGENLRSRQTPIAFLAHGKFWVNNHAHVVRGNAEADTRFLMYALRNLDISGYMTGSTMPKLTQGNMNRIPILTPPLKEQRKIADILGTFDDKIELNRRMNETLEAMARALFKSWFDNGITNDVPNNWRVDGLDQIATFLNGLALQKFPPDGHSSLPVIKIAQLRSGNTQGADRASARIDPAYIIENGDVLFSWSGSLEVVLWCGGRGALNQHLFKVSSAEFPRWFYYLWTKHHLSYFQAIAAGKATTMGHIQRHHLTEAKVVIPSPNELEEMTKGMSPLFDKIVANNIESRTLASMRDGLLPKLLSDEVRIECK